MSIFIAHSEARKGTRLPKSVIDSATAVPGLEGATGADILISPLSTLKLEWVTEALPHQLALKRHCEVGELIQRKTGRDLASSVPKLNYILERMLRYCDRPWLLFVGDLKCDGKGMAIIDGQETNVRCSSVEGAITSWQEHGGYYMHLSRDARIVPWLNRRLVKLRGMLKGKETMLLPRVPSRPLISGHDSYEVMAVGAFASCPEIGAKKGLQLIEHCGSIAWAMKFLSEMKPGDLPGFGKVTVEAARKWMLRDEDMIIDLVSTEDN